MAQRPSCTMFNSTERHSSFLLSLARREWSASAAVVLIIAATVRTEDDDRKNRHTYAHSNVPLEHAKACTITITVGCGCRNEGLRFGWHSIEVDSDGKATVLHHHGAEFNSI